MRVTELIKTLNINPKNLTDFEVKGVSCDSKEVSDNFIFVAIKGNRQDGNKFIEEAIKNGARAVIVQSRVDSPRLRRGYGGQAQTIDTRQALAKLAAEFYGNPSKKIKVVGVTGTNGKTTITYLIEALLKEAHFSPAVIGTINYRFANKSIPSKNTTPGPVQLQSMLSEMLKEGVDYSLAEVSSHALDQNRTEGIDFHSAIFTNLTQDHLDYHKTLENYFKSKAKLFKNINHNAFVVLNNDDKYSRKLKNLTKAGIITYGIENKADVNARKIKFDVSHTRFCLVYPGGKINFKTHLIGRHNVYNVLAAVSWALKEGLGLPIIKSAIEKFYLVPGRLERVNSAGDFCIFVDYAHTDDALKNVITTLVFGCGGERDRTKRPKMGRVVCELSDYAIITNDNPRSEDPLEIIKDIKRGIRKNNYCVVPERTEAIRKSLLLARSGDIVLVAGKGHENYQILKDKTVHFDDREEIKACLKSMN
jgi:UDP-N-acetylmuramoyl-L-alanyl-D-glutamate--2,6-diaminopimelate ligase